MLCVDKYQSNPSVKVFSGGVSRIADKFNIFEITCVALKAFQCAGGGWPTLEISVNRNDFLIRRLSQKSCGFAFPCTKLYEIPIDIFDFSHAV